MFLFVSAWSREVFCACITERGRAATAAGVSFGMAHWLELDCPLALALTASSAPWEEDEGRSCLSTSRFHDVKWQRLPHGGASSAFTHDVVWCPRPCGKAVAVHRFVPRDGNHGRSVEAACRLLNDMAKQEAALNAKSDSSSNVGGYHSARDLWMRPAVQGSALPSLANGLVEMAANAEASCADRPPLSSRPSESWLNVLHTAGAWNVLHTHPGMTYSGAMFVADGGCRDDPDGSAEHSAEARLAGRLAFLPSAPLTLSDHQKPHVVSSHTVPTDAGGGSSSATTAEHARYLVIDPTPGTCVIFPSFVPHFVFPLWQRSPQMRVSLAFNYCSEDG